MKETQFSIEINAFKERVWTILWGDTTFREWANLIDEGTSIERFLINIHDNVFHTRGMIVLSKKLRLQRNNLIGIGGCCVWRFLNTMN